MDCKYIFNTKVYDNYKDLILALSNDDIESALSILFSLGQDKQSTMVDKINTIKKEYKFKSISSMIDGNPDIDVDRTKYFTTQTFIDSALFNIDGEAPMFRLNTDEYLDTVKQRLVREGSSEEEATQRCDKIKENWNKIAKDATDLHRIIVSSTNRDDARHFSGSAMNTSFSGIFDQLSSLVKQIEKDIWKRNKGSTLIRNLNIEADLKNQAEKILGHIDYLFVKDNGDVEIYNIKSSIENEQNWGVVKKEKYRYQLALLKRILEFNGINSEHIRVNLIPVKLKYDNDFNSVVEVTAEEAKPYDFKDTQYIMQRYDNIVSKFITSSVNIEDLDDTIFTPVNTYLNKIFPERDVDIRANGIKESAKGWVSHNWRQIAKPAVNGKGWDIKFPGEKVIHIEDTRRGEDNEEVVNMVIDRGEELFKNTAQEKATYRIISDIQESYKHGLRFFSSTARGNVGALLSEQLRKYFDAPKDLDDGSPDYTWELIENETLTNANILLFRHRNTDQLDVVTITPFDTSIKSYYKGRKNLLGGYLLDMNNERFTMESTYGNIEAIRTMTLLNEILPKLTFKPKLGTLKLISVNSYTQNKGKEYEISSLLPQFDTIVQVVNENNNSLNMPNHFKDTNVQTVDWAQALIETWREAVDSNSNAGELRSLGDIINSKIKTDGTAVDGLETIESVEGKIEKLNIIINKLTNIASQNGVPLHGKGFIDLLKDSNDTRRASIAKVYRSAVKALQMYKGDYALDNEKFSEFTEYTSRPQDIPNSYVRLVAFMFQKSVNTISNQIVDQYSPIREIIMKYYKDIGYTPTRNSLIGDQARMFSNLYEVDPITGEKTMRFKNPYDTSSKLTDTERQFLKDILWEFNKIRAQMWGRKFEYSGKNDSKLIRDIESGELDYLNVPLKRASKATMRSTNMKKSLQDTAKRFMKTLASPMEAGKEFIEGIMNKQELEQRDTDISNLQAYNPFKNTDRTGTFREQVITEKGTNYFEINVEDLIIDFLEKQLQSVEYNKMLTRTKAIILDLQLRGEAGEDERDIDHTIKTIEDFLSVSVYNKSIMEENSQKVEALLAPLRRAVTTCYIAANPVAWLRDTTEGILQNVTRALTKFQTNIDVKDVLYGYKEIITEGSTNLMKITKYDQLNTKFRFSNLDVARISEGLKTGRGGLFNAQNWAYSTLRGPDYLNRMVLFAAKMHHDGCIDAYNIIDGKLQYDWKKDKRFSAYAANDKSNQQLYNQQRAEYLSLIRMFNLENGTKLVEGDNLPDAYTLQQIDSFKTFADNIYGSYNQSTKWKLENIAIGKNFTVFSTWLNGIWSVYSKQPQLSNSELSHVQRKDSNGQLMYFDKNQIPKTIEQGGDPNLPVMEDVPIMVQGCFYTLWQWMKEFQYNKWNIKKANKIFDNEVNRRNLRRMFTDLIVSLLFAAIFKQAVTPLYKEHKATGNGENVISNALLELTYKAGSSCFDSFSGPLAVLDFFGNSTNPATFKLQNKIFNDLTSFLFGDKTFGELMIGSQALPRSFQDTYRMWVRDNK